MNITPDVENVQVGERAPAETVAQRLEKLLQGRSPWKWGRYVRLNDGTVSRLIKGSFPDPARLVPAMRMENMSLDWLVDGRGAPHPVATPASEREAAEWIQRHMNEDDSAQVLVVFSHEAFTPVLHSIVEVAPPDAEPYRYRATTIIGGQTHSTSLVKLLRSYAHPTVRLDKGSAVTSAEVSETRRQQLSRGEMGNYALFGEDLVSGLYGESIADVGQLKSAAYPIHTVRSEGAMVQDASSPWLDPHQRELHALFTALDEADRRAAIRMLRGLNAPAD